MICSKCQSELASDAKICAQCGQAVASVMLLDFPCVLCGAPIPAEAEECPQCGKTSNENLPDPGMSAPEAELEPADVIESSAVVLDAFQLDAVVIQTAPPPPAPRAPKVEFFEPLPTLLRADEVPAAEPAPILASAPVRAAPPEPVVVPEPLVLPVVRQIVPAKPVLAEAVKAPAPTPTPTPPQTPVPVPVTTPVPVPVSVQAPVKAASPQAAPRSVAVPVWPPREEEELGPQPEDVVDEDELRRRRAIRQLIIAGMGVVLVLGTWGYLMRAKPWIKPVLPAASAQTPVAIPAAAPAAAMVAASAPIVAASEPGSEPSAQQVVAAKPVPVQRVVATKPVAKPVRQRSEEDAYLRQIRHQLEQH